MSDREKLQGYIQNIDAHAQDWNTNPSNIALRILNGEGIQNPLNKRAALIVRTRELIFKEPHPNKAI